MKKKLLVILMVICLLGTCLIACDMEVEASPDSETDVRATLAVGDRLAANQPTPTDIDYSLERYNLIRRAYWINGMDERARNLPCEIEKPLSYVILFAGNTAVARFVVDGKVSSLNSYLTPDSEKYEQEYGSNGFSYGDGNDWIADVDGTYGENDFGIFFFDVNGNYWEWNDKYLYTDHPVEIDNPVVNVNAQ